MTTQFRDIAARWLAEDADNDTIRKTKLAVAVHDEGATHFGELPEDRQFAILAGLGVDDPMMFKLDRPSNPTMDAILGLKHDALDYGFVRVIDYMGDEPAIVQAARVSYGRGTKAVSEDRGLIRYLMRHRHTTPFEMCEIKLHCKLPVFVARQWIRHRTANVNEVSARYSILDREFYVPEPEHVQPQSAVNKQGRDGTFSANDREILRTVIRDTANFSFESYESMIDEDSYNLARELGRMVLPLNTYTQWYWKVDLHNLLHFLSLRADPHAQFEIRVYADIICGIVQKWCPAVYEAFEDYVMHACAFSRQEMETLRAFIHTKGGIGAMALPEGSKREIDEFARKLGAA